MPKPVSSSPFQVMEEEAYHAFREWHLFLVMRQKELEAHLVSGSGLDKNPEAKTTTKESQ